MMSDWESPLNSEHGEAIIEECARIVHEMFAQESRPPLSECVQIVQEVIRHAAPFLTSDARAEGYAEAIVEERRRWADAIARHGHENCLDGGCCMDLLLCLLDGDGDE